MQAGRGQEPGAKAVRRSSPPKNKERRWVVVEPPMLRTYRHHCGVCGYQASVVTKVSGGMPRHKCKEWCEGSGLQPARHEWCPGSGLPPARSELLSERRDPNGNVHSNLGKYDDILER